MQLSSNMFGGAVGLNTKEKATLEDYQWQCIFLATRGQQFINYSRQSCSLPVGELWIWKGQSCPEAKR